MSCGVNFMTFNFLYTSQSTFSFLISAVCRQNCTFFKNDRKISHLVQFAYCHYVIKYFMRDMMNYHCLRVFRSRGKRIGKHSPGFSMFLFVSFLIVNCLLTNSMVLHLGDHALLSF